MTSFNPIARILKSRRLRADSEIDALLARLAEPLPADWATAWHIGDRVERTRPDMIDNQPAGLRGTITSIEPIGPQVIRCKPLFVSWGGCLHVGQWTHPNDLKLVRHGVGTCAADALLTLSKLNELEQYAND